MSRATGDRIVVKPTNNIYTALALIGTLTVLSGLVLVYLRAQVLFGGSGLF